VWESGLKIQVVTGNGASFDNYWVVAGAEAAEATLAAEFYDFTLTHIPETDVFLTRHQLGGIDRDFEIQSYAALQFWARAAELAKSIKGADVAPILHKERFDTVLGSIGFNDKGDAVVGPFAWVWGRWRDGTTWEVRTDPLLRGEIVEKK
jgi:branched-chain amino acid transport system substrate-binding protein